MSKFECYKHGENSTKFFLKLKKNMASKIVSRNLLLKGKRQLTPKKLSIKAFYDTLFKQNSSKTNLKNQELLNTLNTKTLTNEQ